MKGPPFHEQRTQFNGGHELYQIVTLANIESAMRALRSQRGPAPCAVRLGRRQWERLKRELPASSDAADVPSELYGMPVYLVDLDDYFEWIYPEVGD